MRNFLTNMVDNDILKQDKQLYSRLVFKVCCLTYFLSVFKTQVMFDEKVNHEISNHKQQSLIKSFQFVVFPLFKVYIVISIIKVRFW